MDESVSGDGDSEVGDDEHESVGGDEFESVDSDEYESVGDTESLEIDESFRSDDQVGDDQSLGGDESIANDEAVSLDMASIEDALTASGGEEAALKRVRFLANLLDDAVRVPGTNLRVGLDPILGILPGAGDSVAAALSLYPVVEAYRLGASRGAIAKMLALVAVDFTVGSVPVLGTLFDAFWKANEWNVRAIERLVEEN